MKNNIVKVSISGIAFVLEGDAYKAMKEYLDKLKAGYAGNPDGREIVGDIETRIAELILDRQGSEQVVSERLAADIISQLGYPDDMDDPSDDAPIDNFPRRLYRNPNGAVIAGICSGMGAYFKVDPVWIRLAFFAPLLLSTVSWIIPGSLSGFFGSLFGMFVLLYFVLWMAVPSARTPRQKLEMRGEKVTASTIRDEAEAAPSPKQQRSASVWADIMYIIGKIFLVLLKIVVIIAVFVFGLISIGLLAAIPILIFEPIGNVSMMGLNLTALPEIAGIGPVGYAVLIILAVLIPIVVIGYLLIRVAFGSHTNKSFLTVMGVIWLILVAYFTVVTVYNIDAFRGNFNFDERLNLEPRERIEHDTRDWDEGRWEEEWRKFSPDRHGSGDSAGASETVPGQPETATGAGAEQQDSADGENDADSGEWRMEEKSPAKNQRQGNSRTRPHLIINGIEVFPR